MSDLRIKVLNQVLEINKMKDYTAHFRFVEAVVSVDIWDYNNNNIYHADTSLYLLCRIKSDLNELLRSGILRVRGYSVNFKDEYMKISEGFLTHSEAVNHANQLDEKYNIKCVVSEVYV